MSQAVNWSNAAKRRAFEWLRGVATADGAPEEAGIALDVWHAETTALIKVLQPTINLALADKVLTEYVRICVEEHQDDAPREYRVEAMFRAIASMGGAKAEQHSAEESVSTPCMWVQDRDDESWDTACGNKHQFIHGDSADNHHAFCPYCGGRLFEPNDDAKAGRVEGDYHE